MKDNLTQQTFSGVIWKFAERFSAQLVSMVVSIILARILMPDDYGIVALVGIFITICNVFVSGGFGGALIQKKDADDIDFSSVFYISFVIALIFYLVLFFCAPLVAKLYENELITPILRVMGLRLPLASINSVQQAYVSRRMVYKKFFWATLIGTIISAVIGIWMAYTGYGVWALVAQDLINVIIDTLVLAIVDRWYPKLKFSFSKVKSLFSYGWKVLVASIIEAIYNDLRGLIIGIKYSSADLAYYNKGNNFPNIITNNINSSLNSVLFSALSKLQDEQQRLKEVVRRGMQVSSYVIFPCMIGLAVIADAFVKAILTEKWLPIIPYLQIMCFIGAIQSLDTANIQIMKALGRSDLFLKTEIIRRIVGITGILISMPFGVFWIALSIVPTALIGLIINAIESKKLLGYAFKDQIKDIMPASILSILMGAIVYSISFVPLNATVVLVLQVLFGIIVYVLASVIFKIDSFSFICHTIKTLLKRKKKKTGN